MYEPWCIRMYSCFRIGAERARVRWRVVAGSCGFLLKRKMRWRRVPVGVFVELAGCGLTAGGGEAVERGVCGLEGFGEEVADDCTEYHRKVRSDGLEKATWGFANFVLGRPYSIVISMVKARELDWKGRGGGALGGTYKETFDELVEKGVVPKPGAVSGA